MHEKAFIMIKNYDRSGKRHIQHVLRERTQKERDKEKIRIYGDNIDDILNMRAKSKKTKNLYLEVMVSEAVEKTQEILEYLKSRFQNHKITAVEHYDESHPHTHFLISWVNDKGMALRLSRKDLGVKGNIYQSIVKITCQQHTSKGQGRRRLSLRELSLREYEAREAEKKIEEMKKQDELALKFLEKMIQLYGKIKLYAISDKGRLELQEVEKVEDVKLKQLRYFEKNRQNGIYFAPANIHQNQIKAIFIDDVPFSRLEELPTNSIIVQTSENKYQAHIRVENIKNYDEFQKFCVRYYDADKSASALLQLRRVAYFRNQKYEDKPLVQEIEEIKKHGDINKLVSLYKESIRIEKSKEEIRQKIRQIHTKKNLKCWKDFATTDDESVTDAKYVYYLIKENFNDEEIAKRLKAESEMIEVRKRNRVDDYIKRTIENVKAFYIKQIASEHTQAITTQQITQKKH